MGGLGASLSRLCRAAKACDTRDLQAQARLRTPTAAPRPCSDWRIMKHQDRPLRHDGPAHCAPARMRRGRGKP
jgi:hypothetical protein